MNNVVIDIVVVFTAILFNLSVVGIMLSRVPGWKEIEQILGLFYLALILPMGLGAFHNAINQRAPWYWILPGLVILYLFIEGILDYILHYDFRRSKWLSLSLSVFYFTQSGMVGYAFLVDVGWGITVLVTYFMSMAATAYSYAKVKHV